MSRNYSISHSAPKDLGNNKMLGLIDVQTSQLDFALLKGIGGSPVGSASMVAAHLAVGTATQGSPVGALHPLVAVGGVYETYSSAQTLPVASGRAQVTKVSNWNELYAVPYPPTPSMITAGSVNNVKSSSGIVYEFGIAWNNANTGGSVVLSNNLAGIRAIAINATSGNQWARLPAGGIPISTSITIQRSFTGAASVFVSFL